MGGGPEYKGGLNVTMAEIGEIIDLEIVPWGNARMGAAWQCQHGPSECAGNTIESCLMMVHPNMKDWWPFINKYEQQAHTCSRTAVPPGACPVALGQMIAKSLSLDWTAVQACYQSFDKNGMPPSSSKGFVLTLAAAKRTGALSPSHNAVPWATQGFTPTAKHIADDDLKRLTCYVCDQYKGTPKPAACNSCKTSVQDKAN